MAWGAAEESDLGRLRAVVVNDTRRRRRDYCCATQPLGRGRAAREPVKPVEPTGVGGCATRGRCLGDTPGGGREPVRVPRPGLSPCSPGRSGGRRRAAAPQQRRELEKSDAATVDDANGGFARRHKLTTYRRRR